MQVPQALIGQPSMVWPFSGTFQHKDTGMRPNQSQPWISPYRSPVSTPRCEDNIIHPLCFLSEMSKQHSMGSCEPRFPAALPHTCALESYHISLALFDRFQSHRTLTSSQFYSMVNGCIVVLTSSLDIPCVFISVSGASGI